MADSASDVPNKFDCIINGHGYLFAPNDAGFPPSVFGVKPEYSYSPTFVARQNVSGDFGDNQQDFFLTATQRDWSLGEQLRFFRASDTDAQRRYWIGTNVEVASVPGQVSMRPLTSSASFAAAVNPIASYSGGSSVWTTTSTNLYSINSAGTITDRGAHGLGTTPKTIAYADGFLYISSEGGGTVGVRKNDGAGGAFSTFSATASDSLAFVNNTLYGYTGATGGIFQRYDTAGTATTIFTFKDADGTSIGRAGKILPFGGKVLLLRFSAPRGPELYLYDGTAPALIAQLPDGFTAADMAVVAGTVFISGTHQKRLSSASSFRPTIYYYANGNLGKLWQSNTFAASIQAPALTSFNGNLVFTDDTTGGFMQYDTSNGGISTIGTYTVTNAAPALGASTEFFLHTRSATTAYYSPSDGFSSSATITSSLFDFDSSLTKLFRGIRVDFDSATDGNGGSIDIAYRVGDVDGSYTSLQTGATSGTEYTLSGISGRSISVKVTLNKGTSTSGPVLKRISVRAAPQEPVYKQFQYVLTLPGRNEVDPNEGQLGQLRDGSIDPLDGNQKAANLVSAITSTSPISVTDAVNGTMSSVLMDQSSCKISQVKPGEYVAVIVGREV